MIRTSLSLRVALGGLLVAGTFLLTTGAVQPQVIPGKGPKIGPGTGFLPKNRPYINLNNNGSLYTFPNPNSALPSQLPFAFQAVAHEDCRLYNNGALLMPMHRLQAAECLTTQQQMQQQQPPQPPIICFLDPITGQLTWTQNPAPGGGPIPINGINYNRYAPARMPYPYAYNPNPYSNYGAYQPSSTTTTGGTGYSSASTKSFAGFGTYSEATFGFGNLMKTDPMTDFGNGFEKAKGSESEEPRK